MSASKCLKRLLGIVCFTTILFGLAALSPLLVGRLLTSEPSSDTGALLVCLFLPTSADWPSHVMSYLLAGVLTTGLFAGVNSLLSQWYRTWRATNALLRFRQPIQSRSFALLLETQQLKGRVDLIEVNRPLAFCYGWIRPRICVSTRILIDLQDIELEALLLHERCHLVKRDPLKVAMSRMLASTFFFLPVVKALHQHYLVAKEIEADRYVLHNQGTDRPLLGALYKLLLQQSQLQPERAAGLAVAGSDEAINQRLDYLLNKRSPVGVRPFTLFVSSAVIAGISTAVAVITWMSAISVLWHQAHSGLGGC